MVHKSSPFARESAAVVLTAMVFSVILRQEFSLHSVHTWIAAVCVGKVTLRNITAYRLRLVVWSWDVIGLPCWTSDGLGSVGGRGM